MSSSSLVQAVKIFFSYAISSPQDERLLKKLTAHLSILRRQKLIDEWYDSAIVAGSNIAQIIETRLRAADIIVLLISADFMASDRCYEIEMQRAIELSTIGAARLIPVILSPTDWETLPINKYDPLPRGGIPISAKNNIDMALFEVARGIRKVVEEIIEEVKKVRKRVMLPQGPFLYFPYRQNAFFTDRTEILASLTTLLPFTQSHQTRILALNGLGGIGKTQIALEYLYRSSNQYQTILWINASSRAMLSTEVSALADKLMLAETDRSDEEQLFAIFKDWLRRQTTWLVVLDQIEDVALIDLIIPQQSSGHVLLTTQTWTAEEIAPEIAIKEMDSSASVSFLLRRAKIISSLSSVEQVNHETIQQAREIVQAMDGFPLALDQAGAYLDETGCGLKNYLELLQKERAALLGRRGRPGNNQSHPDSVMITLSLTIEKVTQEQAINLSLLHLLAFLYPEAIPYELLVDGADTLREPLRSLALRPLNLNEALADLHSYSLIQHLSDTTTLRIHRIAQAVIIDTLTKREQRQWASQAVRLVNRIFPEPHFGTQGQCERYLPQAQHCATLIHEFQLTFIEAALLLKRLGSYCYQQVCYTEAEAYLIQALYVQEQSQRADSLETGSILNAMALLYHRQARYQEAEEIHLRTLKLREQKLGPNHPQTAESLHNLAVLYVSQGRYQQAEQFYVRVLTLDEQMSGPEHLETAKTLNNLGLTYYKQSNYTQAERAYQRALTIYTHTLPANHPDLTYPLNGLGALAEQQGDYQQAEQFYQRALTIREQAFGDKHPDLAQSYSKLADIYEIQGNDQQAETFYLHALTICEQALGPKHPDVALLLNNLAVLADKHGDYQQAKQFYQRALNIYEQTLGQDHPDIADVLNNLGVLYRDTNDLTHAEMLLQRALAIRQQAFGPTHPDTAQSLSNLAALLADQQKYEEAEKMFQQALMLRIQLLGPRHPDSALTRERYASLLEHLGRNEEATKIRQLPT